MAAFKDGIPNSGQAIPNYAQDFCLMNGGSQAGVVGMYPLDEQRCYYFFAFPISQVCCVAPKRAPATATSSPAYYLSLLS